ncbi:3-oxoacyl-ACP synthase III family protein [Shewanella halifaxensis]|nr:3-oxoacyl-[acyl-carrier-protein] synthase III C-terminal domain-containing protein [Shewanella halifaxensis]
MQRVLLLVGDTSSKGIDPEDKSTALLFGDSGSATLLEQDVSATPITFELGTDGSGWEAIVARELSHIEIDAQQAPRRKRNCTKLEMDGAAVFEFTLSRVPPLVNQFIADNGLSADEIDLCVYHQANAYMLKNLAKKSKLDMAKVPMSIEEFGNTSCTSIAVTLAARPVTDYQKSLLVGFGVGLSWGAALCDLSQTKILPIHYYQG